MSANYGIIANISGCSIDTVNHVLQKQQQTGKVVDRPISSRKQVTTEWEDRIITRISLANQSTTEPQIQLSFEEHHEVMISVSTVQH